MAFRSSSASASLKYMFVWARVCGQRLCLICTLSELQSTEDSILASAQCDGAVGCGPKGFAPLGSGASGVGSEAWGSGAEVQGLAESVGSRGN